MRKPKIENNKKGFSKHLNLALSSAKRNIQFQMKSTMKKMVGDMERRIVGRLPKFEDNRKRFSKHINLVLSSATKDIDIHMRSAMEKMVSKMESRVIEHLPKLKNKGSEALERINLTLSSVAENIEKSMQLALGKMAHGMEQRVEEKIKRIDQKLQVLHDESSFLTQSMGKPTLVKPVQEFGGHKEAVGNYVDYAMSSSIKDLESHITSTIERVVIGMEKRMETKIAKLNQKIQGLKDELEQERGKKAVNKKDLLTGEAYAQYVKDKVKKEVIRQLRVKPIRKNKKHKGKKVVKIIVSGDDDDDVEIG